MFCCAGFKTHIERAGERGISILVRRDSSGLAFELQSRGVGFEDQSKLRPMPIDITINISCSVGMRYCPWCGDPLKKMLEQNAEFFESLAEKHEPMRTLVV